jgi:hypothetical protein
MAAIVLLQKRMKNIFEGIMSVVSQRSTHGCDRFVLFAKRINETEEAQNDVGRPDTFHNVPRR